MYQAQNASLALMCIEYLSKRDSWKFILKQAKFLLDKIADMKAQEDAQLATWAKELESVEASIASIDRSL